LHEKDLPDMFFTKAHVKLPPLPEEFLPAAIGIDADLDEVSTVAKIHENSASYEYLKDHDDPWYNMSVQDQLEQSHIDGSHTTVTFKRKKPKALSTFDKQRAWEEAMFGDYEGGGPPIAQHYHTSLTELALKDKSLVHPELGRKKIGPFDTDYKFSKFTATGTALNTYNQKTLEDRIDEALIALNQESDGAFAALRNKKSKKKLSKYKTTEFLGKAFSGFLGRTSEQQQQQQQQQQSPDKHHHNHHHHHHHKKKSHSVDEEEKNQKEHHHKHKSSHHSQPPSHELKESILSTMSGPSKGSSVGSSIESGSLLATKSVSRSSHASTVSKVKAGEENDNDSIESLNRDNRVILIDHDETNDFDIEEMKGEEENSVILSPEENEAAKQQQQQEEEMKKKREEDVKEYQVALDSMGKYDYDMMKDRIGGAEKLDDIASKLLTLAKKVSKQSTRQKKVIDTSLDLFEACDKCRVMKVRSLLLSGHADPNMLTSDDEPLILHCILRLIHMDNITNSIHLTKEELSKETNDRKKLQKICDLLIDFGADINTDAGRDGSRAIHMAAAHNNTKIMNWLAEKKGADVTHAYLYEHDDEDDMQDSSQSYAKKKAPGLKKKGPNDRLVDLNAFCRKDQTSPLMISTHYGNIESIIVLLRFGVNMDLQEPVNGRTALHIAALHGQTRVALLLLRIGAKKLVRDQEGNTPAQLAQNNNFLACAQGIAAYTAKPMKSKAQLTFLVQEFEDEQAKKRQKSREFSMTESSRIVFGNVSNSMDTMAAQSRLLWRSLNSWVRRLMGKEAQVISIDDDDGFLQLLEEEEKQQQSKVDMEMYSLAAIEKKENDENVEDAVVPF
jgi:uncharacterized protein